MKAYLLMKKDGYFWNVVSVFLNETTAERALTFIAKADPTSTYEIQVHEVETFGGA